MDIHENMLYVTQTAEGSPIIHRILRIFSEKQQLVTIDIDDKKAWPVWIEQSELTNLFQSGAAQVLLTDPYEQLRRPDTDYSPASRKIRDERWKKIGELVSRADGAQFIKAERNRIISEIMEKNGIKRKVIHEFLRRYWQRGQIKNALLGNFENCGSNSKSKPGQTKRGRNSALENDEDKKIGHPLTPDDEDNLLKGIHEFYLKESKNSLELAYDLTLGKYYSALDYKDGELVKTILPLDQIPSWDQFRYLYEKTRDPIKEKMLREGIRAYNAKYRPVLKDSISDAPGPLSVGQINSTRAIFIW